VGSKVEQDLFTSGGDGPLLSSSSDGSGARRHRKTMSLELPPPPSSSKYNRSLSCVANETLEQRPSSNGSLIMDPRQKRYMNVVLKFEKVVAAYNIAQKKQNRRHHQLLTTVADFCRYISGGRITSCKSAKDRTGMSVTLEQSRILVDFHRFPVSKIPTVANAMRSMGVRKYNVIKNTGKEKYAFNSFQKALLPKAYRPKTSHDVNLEETEPS